MELGVSVLFWSVVNYLFLLPIKRKPRLHRLCCGLCLADPDFRSWPGL